MLWEWQDVPFSRLGSTRSQEDYSPNLGWATAHYGQSESLLFLQDATGWEREDGSVYQMPEVVPREMWRYSQDCVLQEQENSLLLQVLLEHVVRGNFPFFHVTSCCINCYKLIANIAQVVSILRNRRAQFQNCACTCAIQNCPGNIDRFENAQRNFENAQISIMRGTYTCMTWHLTRHVCRKNCLSLALFSCITWYMLEPQCLTYRRRPSK